LKNPSRTTLALFAILCVVVLLPRLGGPHLHFCLDGSGPAIALHSSGAVDDEAILGTDDTHEDQTVDVTSPVVAKVWPPGFDAVLFLIVLLVLGVFRHALRLPRFRSAPLPALPLFLRPPLRGPPA